MKRLLWALLLSPLMIPSAGFAQGSYGWHQPVQARVYGQGGLHAHPYGHEYTQLRYYHYRPRHYSFRHGYYWHPHPGSRHGCRHHGHRHRR